MYPQTSYLTEGISHFTELLTQKRYGGANAHIKKHLGQKFLEQQFSPKGYSINSANDELKLTGERININNDIYYEPCVTVGANEAEFLISAYIESHGPKPHGQVSRDALKTHATLQGIPQLMGHGKKVVTKNFEHFGVLMDSAQKLSAIDQSYWTGLSKIWIANDRAKDNPFAQAHFYTTYQTALEEVSRMTPVKTHYFDELPAPTPRIRRA